MAADSSKSSRLSFHPYLRSPEWASPLSLDTEQPVFHKPPRPEGSEAFLDVDVVQLRSELRSARVQLSEANIFHEKKLNEQQKKNLELKQKIEDSEARLQKMQANLNFILEEDANKSAKITELEEKLASQQRDHENKQRTSRRENQTLKEELTLLRNETSGSERQYQNDIAIMKVKLSKKEEQLNELLRQQQASSSADASRNRTVESYERQLLAKDAELQSLQQRLVTNENYEAMQKKLDGQVDFMRQLQVQTRSLQVENQQLREQTKQLALIEEERNSLKKKVESLEANNTLLSTQLAMLQKEKSSWHSLLDPADRAEFDSPIALVRKLVSLRHEHMALLSEQGTLRGQLRVLESQVAELNKQVAQQGLDLALTRERLEKEQKNSRRLEKVRIISQKEVEFLRAQLDSIDSEQTMMGIASLDKSKANRISHLEQLLREAQVLLEEDQVPGALPAAAAKLFDVEHDKKLLEEISVLKREKELLEQQVMYLERQVARGDFNPATTKVVHMRTNPHSDASAEHQLTITALKEENERLLQQLQKGDAMEASGLNQASSTNIKLLEKAVADGELKLRRLKEVCGRKISEFREACYSLTGWQIEMKDGEYRLTSMFAEREVDCLLFVKDPATSSMQMLETEFLKQVQLIIKPLVARRNSIAAMTAAITLDLFEKQTAM